MKSQGGETGAGEVGVGVNVAVDNSCTHGSCEPDEWLLIGT